MDTVASYFTDRSIPVHKYESVSDKWSAVTFGKTRTDEDGVLMFMTALRNSHVFRIRIKWNYTKENDSHIRQRSLY
jgi:hypothetical protein